MSAPPVAIFVVLATACLVTVFLVPSWTYAARAPQASGTPVVTPEVAAARRQGVREEVWDSGAASFPLDLCDPGPAASLSRTFTLEARQGLPGAFVVRVLGTGGAELPEVSLTLAVNSTQRHDAKPFQLRPSLTAAGGGSVGVLEIEESGAGTWTATSHVSAAPPAWCDRGGLPSTVQLAALQPWGGVSSAEFSWDGRACTVLIFVWVAVRVLAIDPAEIPLTFACDAYCLAYGCGLAVRVALEARVKSSIVVKLASAARACAMGGDMLLLLGLVLRELRPSSAPARAQKWASSRRSSPRSPPAPLPQIPEDSVLAVDSTSACWAPCLTLAAVAAAALAPALHEGAPPGFFLCADGEDPLSALGAPPAALRLAPLVLAAPAALLVARGGSSGGGQWAPAALAFAGAPAAAWALARLCAPEARRKLQLLAALGAMRTGGAAVLVAGGCQWCRRVAKPRLVYVCAVALFLTVVCDQAEEMAAAGPGPWVPAASANGSAPPCSPPCAAPCAGGADAGVQQSAVQQPAAQQTAAPELVASPPAPPPRSGTKSVVCVADAQEPHRFRVELGEACGDKGWAQRLTFAALLGPEPGTEPVCVAYAQSPVRFLLKKLATCGGSGWKQSSVLFLHSSPGQGRVPLCVAESTSPLRSKVVAGAACGGSRWTQRFVVYADALAQSSPPASPQRPQKAPEAGAQTPADVGLLRASRREADVLQALLAQMPAEQLRSHSLWHASVMTRRAYYTSAYAAQVDPGGAKEAGVNHAWDAETQARRRLHCEGWVRDRTDTHQCAGPGGTAVSRPVGSSCAGPKGQAPLPFLRPGRMEEEGPKLCTSLPAVGQLRKDECAEAKKLASELVGRTHGAGVRAPNEAELPFEGCPTCAVVGSSGNLLGQGLGPDIDAHDVVIRINCAPTLGFSVDVGARTTHRLFYPEASWFADPQDEPCAQLADLAAEGSSLLAVLFKPRDIEWWHAMVSKNAPPKTGFWHPVPTKMSLPRARVAVVSVSWLNHATAGLASLERSLGADVQKEKWPSTGFFGMLLAMQLCRTVDIYGFGRRFRNGSQLDPSMIKYYM